MERKIKIFKSFEEQEAYNLDQMRNSTPMERFRRLYMMQQISRRLHPVIDTTRQIIIRNGRTQ